MDEDKRRRVLEVLCNAWSGKEVPKQNYRTALYESNE